MKQTESDWSYNRRQKPGKYKQLRTMVDGIKFASQKEANYYGVLKMRMRAGEIRAFEMQKRFKLVVNEILIATYVCDFVVHHFDGNREVIDVKSDMTRKLALYQMKKKLMMALYKINIKEV